MWGKGQGTRIWVVVDAGHIIRDETTCEEWDLHLNNFKCFARSREKRFENEK